MSPGGESGLVGRSAELGLILELVHHAVGGEGRIALIEGEAGIGKTRLLAELLARCSHLGVETLAVAAEELERRRPFAVIAECLAADRRSPDERRAGIARLLEGASPALDPLAQAAQLEFAVTEAVLALIEDLCAHGPIVIAVDDLQWADPSSVLVLHRLGRRLSVLPALLVCSARRLPRSQSVASLIDGFIGRGAVHLVLGPLDEEALRTLTAALVGGRPGAKLLAQVAATGGNPLFLVELATALRTAGALLADDQGVVEIQDAAEPLPASLSAALLHRISFLPLPVAEVLRLASVLGARFSLGDLAVLLGRSPTALVPALRYSLQAGLLDPHEDRLAFRHDLIREAFYHDLPLAVRTGLHRQAARALGDAGAPPERVAEHLMRAASPGDPEAVRWLHQAARQAAPRSPAVAVELLQRSVDLIRPSDEGRDAVLADLALSLMWSGRFPEAEAICREALARPHDPGTDASFRLCLTESLLIGEARVEEARREAEAAIASRALSAVERARFRAVLSHARMFLGDLEGAVESARLAQSAGAQSGDDLACCLALETRALCAYLHGHFRLGLDLIEQAVELADRSPDRAGHRHPLNLVRGLCLMELDQVADAHRAIQLGRRLAEELGTGWDLPVYHFGEAGRHLRFGGWDDALAEIAAGLDLAEEMGMRWAVAARAYQALIALHRDALATGQEAIAAAERQLARSGPQFGLSWVMWARALLLEASGEVPAALTVLGAAWDLCTGVGVAADYPFLGPDLVRLAVAAGDRHRAEEVAKRVAAVAADNAGVESLQGAAERCLGLVDDDPDALLAAVASYRASPRPLELGLACEEAGAALAGRGLVDDTRPLFEEALGVYERLHASRDVARTLARMRQLGLRRGRRGRRARAQSGWEALTHSERRVAELVVEGLSNSEIAERLFVSRHTVHTHLGHALTKLGLRSRVQLAAEVTRRRLVPSAPLGEPGD